MRLIINTCCTYYQWVLIYNAYKEAILRGNQLSLGFFLSGFVDWFFQVFYVIEARSVLQNRLPQFRSKQPVILSLQTFLPRC